MTAEESCRQALKTIADACDQESLARAGGYLFRYVQEETVLRARRCLASERAGREALRVRLADEERANAFGVGVLCRLAFPGDES